MLKALELAAFATEANRYEDWWWKLQIAKCYLRFLFLILLSNLYTILTRHK